ncbi:hypothetical protein C8R44DRAFT_804513 [Mycena epipterygia]|nr:hypothetical protein C8R44DRAFT_804513 [Mycena epipterygia]
MSRSIDGLGPAQVQFQVDTISYICSAAFTILFYDYLLTLERETSRYWGTPITWGTALFYLNRYELLIGVIPVSVEYLLDNEKVCPVFGTYFLILIVFSQVIVAIISIMRTYALFGRSRLVLGFMSFMTAGSLAFGTWTIVTVSELPPPPAAAPTEFHGRNGCARATSNSMAHLFGASWTCLLVFDCMILSLTAWKAFVSYRQRGGRLLSTLVRDGVVYFLIMVFLHAGNLASFLNPGQDTYSHGLTTTIVITLSSVLMSRFMLDLRDPNLLSDNQSLVLDTATLPDISLVEPYYGSADSGETWSEEDRGRRWQVT